jgi:hypothetical protein
LDNEVEEAIKNSSDSNAIKSNHVRHKLTKQENEVL